jgi:MFS superfamily sulfate permease-like transporter
MTRCLSCNGILKSKEKSCYGCGTAAVEVKRNGGNRFASFVTALFIASALLTVASMFAYFSDRTPPFSACLAATVVLMFVKRSADQFKTKES